MFRSRPIGPCALVASTTSSRRPPANALPTISSDSPAEYTSAVSTKLIPASSARWMIGDRLVVVRVAPRAEHHRPEAQGADLHPGRAERAVPHTLVLQGQTGVRPGHRVQQTVPGRRDVGRAAGPVAAEADVGDEHVVLRHRVHGHQFAGGRDTTVIAPVISVATQTLPSPSTASESRSWKPGKSYSRWSGRGRRVGEHAGRGDVPGPQPPVVRLGDVHLRAVGRQADAVGRDQREDDLGDRRAVGLRVVQPAAVQLPVAGLAEVGEPEAAVGVEDDVVRTAQRGRRRTRCRGPRPRRWSRSTRWMRPPM